MYITNNGYAILPTNDDMVHGSHKYIDRKMGKNGKWIYIYNTVKKKINRTKNDIKKYQAKKNAERDRKEAEKQKQLREDIINAMKSGEIKDLSELQREKEKKSLSNKLGLKDVVTINGERYEKDENGKLVKRKY